LFNDKFRRFFSPGLVKCVDLHDLTQG
jgi:hypothetical protein